MIVSNTSPLIHLSKVGKLGLLKKLFGKVEVPFSVYDEILKQPNNTETIIIKKAVNEGWLNIKKLILNEPLSKFSTVARAELEAITLAIKRKSILLIDDQTAVQIANIYNVKVHGTLFIILQAYKNKLIKKQEAVDIVNQMMRNEFYISSNVYALFLRLLNS